MYANHKKIDLHDIEVELAHSRIHAEDCEICEKQDQMIDKISRIITLTGNLDEAQRARLLEIADKCPVHKTLTNQIHIETTESSQRIIK
jgi:putative redox protein